MSEFTPPPPPPAYGAVPTTPPLVSPYASWLTRVGANLLDGLVGFAVAIPLLLPGIVLLIASSASGTFEPVTGVYTGGTPSPAGIALLVLGYLAVLAFTIWNFVLRQGRTGQTLGKKWLGIKVVREANGEVPGGWLALGRYLLQAILTTITLYLNVLWPLWDAKKQALHDKIVGTVVLRVS